MASNTPTRDPKVCEGWVRSKDNTYFIVVKIDTESVTLISKDFEPVKVTFYSFRKHYSYKDRGVEYGEAWTYIADFTWNATPRIYVTDGSVNIITIDYDDVGNRKKVWGTRLSTKYDSSYRDIPISDLLRFYQKDRSDNGTFVEEDDMFPPELLRVPTSLLF